MSLLAEEEIPRRLEALGREVTELGKLIRGNGASGLRTEIELLKARVGSMECQWRWLVGIVSAVLVALAQAYVRR